MSELIAHIDLAERTIEDARAFEHDHALTTRATRKLPGDALRVLKRWRSALAGDTVEYVVADGTATKRAASADKQVTVVCTEEPQVPEITTVRLSDELRECVDQYGREHRWPMAEVIRVAVERLVGFEDHQTIANGSSDR